MSNNKNKDYLDIDDATLEFKANHGHRVKYGIYVNRVEGPEHFPLRGFTWDAINACRTTLFLTPSETTPFPTPNTVFWKLKHPELRPLTRRIRQNEELGHQMKEDLNAWIKQWKGQNAKILAKCLLVNQEAKVSFFKKQGQPKSIQLQNWIQGIQLPTPKSAVADKPVADEPWDFNPAELLRHATTDVKKVGVFCKKFNVSVVELIQGTHSPDDVWRVLQVAEELGALNDDANAAAQEKLKALIKQVSFEQKNIYHLDFILKLAESFNIFDEIQDAAVQQTQNLIKEIDAEDKCQLMVASLKFFNTRDKAFDSTLKDLMLDKMKDLLDISIKKSPVEKKELLVKSIQGALSLDYIRPALQIAKELGALSEDVAAAAQEKLKAFIKQVSLKPNNLRNLLSILSLAQSFNLNQDEKITHAAVQQMQNIIQESDTGDEYQMVSSFIIACNTEHNTEHLGFGSTVQSLMQKKLVKLVQTAQSPDGVFTVLENAQLSNMSEDVKAPAQEQLEAFIKQVSFEQENIYHIPLILSYAERFNIFDEKIKDAAGQKVQNLIKNIDADDKYIMVASVISAYSNHGKEFDSTLKRSLLDKKNELPTIKKNLLLESIQNLEAHSVKEKLVESIKGAYSVDHVSLVLQVAKEKGLMRVLSEDVKAAAKTTIK